MDCNETRIFDKLQVTFTFTSTAGGDGMIADDNEAGAGFTLQSHTISSSAGSVVTVTVLWSEICTQLFSAGCSSLTSYPQRGTIRVGIDADQDGYLKESTDDDILKFTVIVHDPTEEVVDTGDCSDTNETGVCGMTLFPGDRKAYVEDLVIPQTTFPIISSGINFEKLRIMYSTTTNVPCQLADFQAALPGSKFKDFEFEDDGSAVTPDAFDGLENNQNYCFRFASVDTANNVSHFAGTTYLLNNTLDYSVSPNEVVGLLKDDLNCFIATAAYGSTLEPKLDEFRKFRRLFLLRSSWGKAFVKWYYQYGQLGARWLESHDWAKPVARALLWPVYQWTVWTNRFGLLWGFFPLLLLPLLMFTLMLWLRKKSCNTEGMVG